VQLTRGRVIAAAMSLIEAEGAQAPCMSRLATELGSGLVTLYSHVPSAQALLDGVAGAIVSAIEVSATEAASVPDSDWPDQLRAQARAARRATAAHPRCTIAVAGRRPGTAAVLRPAEQLLGTLRAAGFDGPDAARITRILAAYLVGTLVREVGVTPALRADSPESTSPVLRAASFPHLTAVTAETGGAGAVSPAAADFDFGLDLLLSGLGTLLDARASDPRSRATAG
jgi:AcrR family transcriptional regulator